MKSSIKSLSTLILTLTLMFGLVAPITVSAQTSVEANLKKIQELTAQIKTLQEQIANLQKQQAELQTTTDQTVVEIIASLREGSEGDEVKTLQMLLALDAAIYPEGKVTGYYGPMTRRAVERFQRKHGFETVGFVGPRTRAELNKLIRSSLKDLFKNNNGNHGNGNNGNNGESNDAPKISDIAASPSQTSANVVWRTNEEATGKVYYGTTSPLNLSSAPSVTETTWWWYNNLYKNHSVNLPNLTASTTYYYVIESKDKKGNTASSSQQSFMTTGSTADTTDPTISAITVSSVGTSTATVSWTTNENANSKVYYGTSTPIATGTAQTKTDGSLVTSHSLQLTGLNPNTTYYFKVESTDGAGNDVLSSETSFATAVVADTSAPTISSVNATPGTTTATVTWNTNEVANSRVYYGTTTPLVLGSASTLFDGSLILSHSLGLSGLTASTTYYMVVESKDAANNTSTSSQSLFITN